jgi:hypothetical protein
MYVHKVLFLDNMYFNSEVKKEELIQILCEISFL